MVRITKNTGQAELDALYRAVVRREFLCNTPLNIKTFLRYALLFILFPGMRLGFRMGLLMTALFSVFLLVLLIIGAEAWAVWAVAMWAGLGLLVLVWVSVRVIQVAASTKQARLEMLPAEEGLPSGKTHPEMLPLPWKKVPHESHRHTASVVLEIPHDGIYAFILQLHKGQQDCRIVTHGRRGTCVVYAQGGGASGTPFQALILYRLAAGRHELRWSVDSAHSTRPQATLTQMNDVLPAS